ncbi:DNA recombination protein RmuC [Serinibacter arcticus]|uniref:DNA recombination protein RmuC n=1 Tax=Serinibacter arcticus TaxID=1655435 RepID=A0A2U1ZYM9_9MICO|nr:DNA recombination protein RmuC [Serinibacter arcticus]PWD52022.1 DNA recombination protein RmuC [Serinibacter arcticus]
MDIATLLAALLALAVGAVVGYLLAQGRTSTARTAAAAEVAALTSRLEGATAQLTEAREASATAVEQARAAADAAVEQARADGIGRVGEAERRGARAVAEAEDRHAATIEALEERHATAVGTLEQRHAETVLALRADNEKRVAELREDTKRLADEFDALSKKALAANTEAFLAQAEERLKRTHGEGAAELAKREEAVKQLVAPLAQTLTQVRDEMTTAEKARLEAHASLAQQVRGMQESSEMLRTETSALVNALRAPQVRGQWGEMQLRRTVEAAGMVEHVSFEEQVQLEGGKLRPDLVVSLPDGKQIIVDSKVAFNGYLEAMEARDDQTRAKRLAAHARHMRTHIDQLSGKEYWSHLDSTPEFTVMFVPSEVFLNAALEQDPTLQEYAFARNVVPATPATLVALLRTVAYTWRQEKLAAEANQVFSVGRELHKRLATFGTHLDQLARKLNGTVDQFNKMTSSLDARVVPQVRKFSALQGLEPALEVPPPLEVLAVPAQKSDLHAVELTDAEIERDRAEQQAALEAEGVQDDLLGEIAAGPSGSASRSTRGRASA